MHVNNVGIYANLSETKKKKNYRKLRKKRIRRKKKMKV
jgi:hypothetical protein